MSDAAFALFDTTIGTCAIAWSAAGIAGLQLPESDAEHTRSRARRRFAAPSESVAPPPVAQVIADVVALLRGQPVDLSTVALDLDRIPPFDRRVYECTRRIPPGRTLTYGAVAAAMGEPLLQARAVGQALGRNPFALIVPCHRVLGARGQIGGFSAAGGSITKQRLLAIEGARAGDEPDLFDAA